MTQQIETGSISEIFKPFTKMALVGAAVFAFATAAPTAASAHNDGITINGLSFGDDEDVLQQLIDMDADDIEELREEMADAREDIADAILDIEEAREDVKEAPGGAVIMKIALGTASKVVTKATGKVFYEVLTEISAAAEELETVRDEIGDAEYTETRLVISVLREEIASIEEAISELTAAMRA